MKTISFAGCSFIQAARRHGERRCIGSTCSLHRTVMLNTPLEKQTGEQ